MKTQRRKSLLIIALVTAMVPLALQAPAARAASLQPDSYIAGKVLDKFDDTWLFAATFKLGRPKRLLVQYVDLTLGVITAPGDSRPFISLAPVWRAPLFSDNVAIKFSFDPTLIAGSTFDHRDMGGNLHFTSAVAIEGAFGVRRSITLGLRIQHTSNGGLSSTNPGMDIVGLSFSYNPNR